MDFCQISNFPSRVSKVFRFDNITLFFQNETILFSDFKWLAIKQNGILKQCLSNNTNVLDSNGMLVSLENIIELFIDSESFNL